MFSIAENGPSSRVTKSKIIKEKYLLPHSPHQCSPKRSGKQLSLGDIHICLHAVALMMIRANLLITISTVTVLFSARAIST